MDKMKKSFFSTTLDFKNGSFKSKICHLLDYEKNKIKQKFANLLLRKRLYKTRL